MCSRRCDQPLRAASSHRAPAAHHDAEGEALQPRHGVGDHADAVGEGVQAGGHAGEGPDVGLQRLGVVRQAVEALGPARQRVGQGVAGVDAGGRADGLRELGGVGGGEDDGRPRRRPLRAGRDGEGHGGVGVDQGRGAGPGRGHGFGGLRLATPSRRRTGAAGPRGRSGQGDGARAGELGEGRARWRRRRGPTASNHSRSKLEATWMSMAGDCVSTTGPSGVAAVGEGVGEDGVAVGRDGDPPRSAGPSGGRHSRRRRRRSCRWARRTRPAARATPKRRSGGEIVDRLGGDPTEVDRVHAREADLLR